MLGQVRSLVQRDEGREGVGAKPLRLPRANGDRPGNQVGWKEAPMARTVVVTGGNRGIGLATAQAFANRATASGGIDTLSDVA